MSVYQCDHSVANVAFNVALVAQYIHWALSNRTPHGCYVQQLLLLFLDLKLLILFQEEELHNFQL
jgi:hypothetical protein